MVYQEFDAAVYRHLLYVEHFRVHFLPEIVRFLHSRQVTKKTTKNPHSMTPEHWFLILHPSTDRRMVSPTQTCARCCCSCDAKATTCAAIAVYCPTRSTNRSVSWPRCSCVCSMTNWSRRYNPAHKWRRPIFRTIRLGQMARVTNRIYSKWPKRKAQLIAFSARSSIMGWKIWIMSFRRNRFSRMASIMNSTASSRRVSVSCFSLCRTEFDCFILFTDRGTFYLDNGHSFDYVLFYGNESLLFELEIMLFQTLVVFTRHHLLSMFVVAVVYKVIESYFA